MGGTEYDALFFKTKMTAIYTICNLMRLWMYMVTHQRYKDFADVFNAYCPEAEGFQWLHSNVDWIY